MLVFLCVFVSLFVFVCLCVWEKGHHLEQEEVIRCVHTNTHTHPHKSGLQRYAGSPVFQKWKIDGHYTIHIFFWLVLSSKQEQPNGKILPACVYLFSLSLTALLHTQQRKMADAINLYTFKKRKKLKSAAWEYLLKKIDMGLSMKTAVPFADNVNAKFCAREENTSNMFAHLCEHHQWSGLLGVQARGGWEPRLQSIAVPRPSGAGNSTVIDRVFIIIFPFIKVVAQPKAYVVESWNFQG